MNTQKIFPDSSIVNLKKLSKSLEYRDVYTGWLKLIDLILAYAHPDFFQNLKVSAPLVARVYPLRVDKDLFDEYSHFLILQTDQHLLKADISGGDIGISECIGVSDVWFYRKGIRSDYAEAYIEELHELTLKPF